MKYYRIWIAVIVLVLTSLACQAVGGGSRNTPVAPPATNDAGLAEPQPTAVPPSDNNTTEIETDFPMTSDAYNVTEAGGSLIFYTKLSQEDAMDFYRDEYTAKGYTEREILTIVSDGVFSMVFDGDPSGKAVVIQSVDLGDGSRTISIRLEDV
ncbi:MAG TPA: hypothetical protein VFQ13_24445 [Anaerolineales bacterium]|nr:hypothetical protein [Anaerolineales bacterium]